MLHMDSEEACIAHMSSCSAFTAKFGDRENGTTIRQNDNDGKAGSSRVEDDKDTSANVSTGTDATEDEAEEEFSGHVELWNPKQVKVSNCL